MQQGFELRQVAKMIASAIAVEDTKLYIEQVDLLLLELKKLGTGAKIALKQAYIWSRKAPREERQDLFQELFLELWKLKPPNDKLAYSIARCDWQDFWKRFSIRQHYSLDQEVHGVNGDTVVFGELIADAVNWEEQMNGELDGRHLWDQLPGWVKVLKKTAKDNTATNIVRRVIGDGIKYIVYKRLAGYGITGGERIMLDKFARAHAGLLAM